MVMTHLRDHITHLRQGRLVLFVYFQQMLEKKDQTEIRSFDLPLIRKPNEKGQYEKMDDCVVVSIISKTYQFLI